jgi:hypothetical protein
MHLLKARPKLTSSYSRRRIRLGVAHHGAPSSWTAPVKDRDHDRDKTQEASKKRR